MLGFICWELSDKVKIGKEMTVFIEMYVAIDLVLVCEPVNFQCDGLRSGKELLI